MESMQPGRRAARTLEQRIADNQAMLNRSRARLAKKRKNDYISLRIALGEGIIRSFPTLSPVQKATLADRITNQLAGVKAERVNEWFSQNTPPVDD